MSEHSEIIFKMPNNRIIELCIQLGDITKTSTEAIVNAAHSKLSCGGGVDGAIHKAAGSCLLDECLGLPLNKDGNRCEIGEAKITLGYNLPSKYVIHTVAPSFVGSSKIENGKKIYISNDPKISDLLSSCYRNCLILANSRGIKTLAFPSLGTGGHSFPVELAAKIAIDSTLNTAEYQLDPLLIETIVFVLFSKFDYDEYKKALWERK